MIARSKWGSLAVLALCSVAAMALWFSVTAVVPSLAREFALDGFAQALFTSAAMAGFVAGSLVSALLGLADRFDPRRFFMVSALVGALANGAILVVGPDSVWAAVLRFATGACMAGVYPVGMKLASTWAKRDMGLIVGLLIGALTLGTAMPHLVNALGGIDWRFTIAASTTAAVAAALLINLAGLGPEAAPAPRFQPGAALAAWRNLPLRLANFGYLGHMWELFAMWAWIGAFLEASFALSLDPGSATTLSRLATFATIGMGALGCLAAGVFADRIGRTTVTMIAMAVSGSCALLVGFLYGGSPVLLTLLCLIWGISVVADSAQFSASVAELSEPRLIGTMLTVQTAVGFLLTLITIHLLPVWVEWAGWGLAFAPLAIGPFLGVWAMARLRAHPDSIRIAGGRR